MRFLHNLSIKAFLIGIVSVLVCVLTIYSILRVTDAYNSNKEMERVELANRLADKVLVSSGLQAKERGMTAMVLASKAPAEAQTIEKIMETRKTGVAMALEARTMAGELLSLDPDNTSLSKSIKKVESAQTALDAIRAKVDDNLTKSDKTLPAPDWFNAMTAYIDANAEMRSSAFASTIAMETHQEAIRMNIEVKQAIWLVSEYAGRERAAMASIIGTKSTLDPQIAEKLKTFRTILEISLKPIIRLKDRGDIDAKVIEAIKKMEEVYLGSFSKVRSSVYAESATGNYPINSTEWIKLSSEAIDTIIGVSAAVGATVDNRIDADLASSKTNMYASIVISILVIAAGIGSIIVIKKKVITPLEHISEKMTEVESTGDLTIRVEIESEDENGLVATSFNNMVNKFKVIVCELHNSIEYLASASEELSTSAVQIARGSKSQGDKAAQVSTASHQMSATLTEVVKNISSASEAAQDANRVALNGGDIVDKTIRSMSGIAETAKESSRIISSLGERSREIGNIVNVIDDIADQTNLLALNAAIEAARAGEQGRGFAVVADEVRKLAEKTMGATKEIGAMIKTMQREMDSAISSMNTEVKAVDEGSHLAMEAGDALKEIVSRVDVVTNMLSQIATASEEQSCATEQISGDVEAVAHVISDLSSNAEQIARSSEEIANLASGLKSQIEAFKLSRQEQSDNVVFLDRTDTGDEYVESPKRTAKKSGGKKRPRKTGTM